VAGRRAIGEGGGIQAGGFELDAIVRHLLARLAVARINMGEIEERMVDLVLLVVENADFR
jgi:hypothetical protein